MDGDLLAKLQVLCKCQFQTSGGSLVRWELSMAAHLPPRGVLFYTHSEWEGCKVFLLVKCRAHRTRNPKGSTTGKHHDLPGKAQ